MNVICLDCGSAFDGGRRSEFCPACKAIRKRKARNDSRRRVAGQAIPYHVDAEPPRISAQARRQLAAVLREPDEPPRLHRQRVMKWNIVTGEMCEVLV